MATLYKKPNSPFYYAQYFDADGKRVSKSTGTTLKREADRIATGFESSEREERRKASQLPKAFAAILETVTREAASGDLTLARAEEFVHRLHKLANPNFVESSLKDFWRKWITEQKRHVGESTAKGYEQDLDLFTVALGQRIMNAPVNALTSDQVNAAIDKAKKKESKATGRPQTVRRASTVNKALASLRRVMEIAVAKGMAPTTRPSNHAPSVRRTVSNVHPSPWRKSAA